MKMLFVQQHAVVQRNCTPRCGLTLAAGVLYINYDFGPKSPTELISLRVRVNNNYALEEMTTE